MITLEIPLQYHSDTYKLLTEKPIDPEKAIEEQINEEPTLLSYYAIDRQITGETLRKVAEAHEHRLGWTKLYLYQRPIRFSGSNRRQLTLLEQRYHAKLPPAVVEWYSLDILPEIMTVRGAGPYHIHEMVPLTDHEFYRLNPDHSLQDLWYFLYDEYIQQGGECIAFRIDAGDDPPVVGLSGDKNIKLADHFSDFIYRHFWDWLGHYTFEYWFSIHHHPAFTWLKIPERYHLPIERLRQEFSEISSTNGLRFYDEHCRIFAETSWLWEDDKVIESDSVIAGGTFRADSIAALTNLIERLWGNDAPVFRIAGADPKLTEHINSLRRDLLRRVLSEANDWISAERLAPILGASVSALNSSMSEQINWLIEQGEVEPYPDNAHKTEPEHRFRLKQR